MENKIIHFGRLVLIMERLNRFQSLLIALSWAFDDNDTVLDSLAATSEFLDSILKDFKTVVDSAEDYSPTAEVQRAQ